MLDELLATPEFQHWQWDVALRMRKSVERVYATDPDEVRSIEAMVRKWLGQRGLAAGADP